MPLINDNSHKSFVKNLKTELEHGKPMKQSLAIAYGMKRKAKKMADGGPIVLDPDKVKDFTQGFRGALGHAHGGRIGEKSGDILETTKGTLGGSGKYSQGAIARSGKKHTDIGREHGDSIHAEMGREAIREAKEVAAHKAYEISAQNPKLKGLADGGEVQGEGLVDRIIKRMSEGGKVANDTLGDIDETPAQYDDLVLNDNLDAEYSGSEEIGDAQEDDDRKDIVSRVMSSRRKKDKMPKPA